jgi:hypothetical protein
VRGSVTSIKTNIHAAVAAVAAAAHLDRSL